MKKKLICALCILAVLMSLSSGLIACNKTYKVTYIMPLWEGGSLTEENVYATVSQAKGSNIVFPETPYTEAPGYEFGGWYDAGGKLIEDGSVKVNSDMTLYGKWREITHTITYDFNGGGSLKPGEKNPDSFTEIEGVDKLYSPMSNRIGYEFLGWYDADGTLYNSIKSGTKKDLKLTAHWGAIEYMIDYRGLINTDINPEENPKYYTIQQEINLLEASRKGYDFLGWFDQPKGGNKIEKIAKGSTGKKIVYAQWQAIEYNLTLNASGGQYEQGVTVPQKYTTEGIIVPMPYKVGYKFIGWKDDKSGNVFGSITLKGATGDKSYTAQWEKTEYTLSYYEIFYEGDNIAGGEEGTLSHKFTVDDEVIVEDIFTLPTRDGYTFVGWFMDAKKETPVSKLQIEKDTPQEIDIYAIWQKN